ncbi:MAG: flagellar biosynthesis protein FlhB [Oligoflexia bacterium]|nr:flagellar biosynthesis protein FlhB [Oligoflexia bacterium]
MAENNSQDNDEDKTEEPTAQRLEDFRKEGQVAQSKEVTSLLVLLSSLGAMYALGPHLTSDYLDFMRKIFVEAAVTDIDVNKAGILLRDCLAISAKIVLPIAFAGFAAGIIGSIVQFGFVFTSKPLEPQLDRINPINGFKRIFSFSSLVEGFKSVLKLAAVIAVTYYLVESELIKSAGTAQMEESQLFSYMGSTAFRLIGSVCLGLIVVAALDLFYQKFRFWKNLMMTKQEVKQEHKQREGDPLLKARIRSIQRETARKRMMKDIPTADVIVTNPTHIAVALKYDAEKMAAPKVVAKGADLIAQRIKEIGRANGVPLVENVPLARALHKSVKIGGSVPRALYQAVAEVLAYVYRLKGKFNTK